MGNIPIHLIAILLVTNLHHIFCYFSARHTFILQDGKFNAAKIVKTLLYIRFSSLLLGIITILAVMATVMNWI